jgi:hypothetical protein
MLRQCLSIVETIGWRKKMKLGIYLYSYIDSMFIHNRRRQNDFRIEQRK